MTARDRDRRDGRRPCAGGDRRGRVRGRRRVRRRHLVGRSARRDRGASPGRRGTRSRCDPCRVRSHRDARRPAPTRCGRKDSSLVRCAEAVRDGQASAMVGAGNTGATMAAALLRFGRIKGVHRPAIAIPMPVIGEDRIQLLVDAGATVDPEPEWLVEWAELAASTRAFASVSTSRRSRCCRTAKSRARATRCASRRRRSSPT